MAIGSGSSPLGLDFDGRELRPGIYHMTDSIALRYYPGDFRPDWVEREIQVWAEQWPFEAGETPFAYARRIVATVDEGGFVTDVQTSAEVRWREVPVLQPEPTLQEERITIKYRTPRRGKEG